MGCASSKRIEATIDVYRPPPTSFAVFDINAIDEPWLKGVNKEEDCQLEQQQQDREKLAQVPQPILEKLNAIDEVPRSWDEVSKELEHLKPTLQNSKTTPQSKLPKPVQNKPLLTLPASVPVPAAGDGDGSPVKKVPRKSFSFHTLEELESKLSSKDSKSNSKSAELRKTEWNGTELGKFSKTVKNESRVVGTESVERTQSEGFKSVKENIFVLRDKMEREKEGKVPNIVKFNPLSDYPELSPPGGSDSVVLYTTSLGGVRRTFEDCNKVRLILESHRVVFDERDVALHGEFRNELKMLLGEGEDASVPRLFVKGRYVGGVEEVVSLNETSRLGRMLNWARVEKGVGRLGCEGCGGARFVPCFDCGGSCKVINGDVKERCPKCNENGLIHCPACL